MSVCDYLEEFSAASDVLLVHCESFQVPRELLQDSFLGRNQRTQFGQFSLQLIGYARERFGRSCVLLDAIELLSSE